MATAKQREAARKDVKKAQAGAEKKQTMKNLDAKTRTALGEEAAAVRRGDAQAVASWEIGRSGWPVAASATASGA